MQLAFVLYKYFPFGGLQRDFMRIALECQQRGHQIRIYSLFWEGDIPPGFEVVMVPVKALFNHWRYAKFSAWVKADLAKRPVARLIGFNKMPTWTSTMPPMAASKTRRRASVLRCIAFGAVTCISPSMNGRCSPGCED
ncbi:hypothetical protein QNM99_15205 [Pseudomonas sp. PCH446]